jgi:flavodoxin
MLTIVIYDTKFGNTAKVAEAIARGAGGRGGGAPPALRGFVDTLPPTLRGVPAATFDTRYRGATWLMGSAANEAARYLGKAGARIVAPPESFFIERGGPVESQGLEAGELERAEAWGRSVVAAAPSRVVAP